MVLGSALQLVFVLLGVLSQVSPNMACYLESFEVDPKMPKAVSVVPKLVSGKIGWETAAPAVIPAGSKLSVVLRDISLADGPARTLGSSEVALLEDDTARPYTYTIPFNADLEAFATYSVSAVLNVGWSPVPGSDEWLRSGDWLTMTQHQLQDVTPDKTEYSVDLSLEQYIQQ